MSPFRNLFGAFVLLFLMAFAPKAAAGDALASLVRFRLNADPSSLDWNIAHSSLETYIIMNLMEGLVEEGPELKVRPALAESWDISPDGKTYTFNLRPGVKWSDGRPLQASDFEDSWFRLIDPKMRSSYANFLFDIENAEAFHAGRVKNRAQVGIKAISPNRFQVTLRNRVPHFVHLATFWVTFPIRLDLIRKYGAQWATPGKIATLGPYLLSSWKKGQSIRMKRNPNYFGTLAPGIPQEVEGVIDGNDQHARELFETGKLDFLLNATTQDLLRARSQTKATGPRVEQYPYLATYYLAFNVKSGPLKDRAIRSALATAVDREAIPALMQGGQTVAHSFFPPGVEGHSDHRSALGTLHEARSALGRAGYVEGQRFPTLQFWVERFDGAEKVSRFIAKGLREKLGINAEPRFGTSADYQKDPDAAIFLTHWGADYPDAGNFLSVYSGSASNYSRWRSAEFDALLDKARQSTNNGERLLAYAQAEKILLEKDVVILPLFYRKNTVLLGPRIKNFQLSPLNYLFFKNVLLSDKAPGV